MFYSKTTGGFYDLRIHGDNIPTDAVEITTAEHQALLKGQSAGKRIVAGPTGAPSLADPLPPTAEQQVAAYTAAVQRHLDAEARALGYDSIASAVTYADEPAVPKFQSEGQAFRAWRSLVWAHCYAVLDAVQAGNIPMPTADDLIGGLPALSMSQ